MNKLPIDCIPQHNTKIKTDNQQLRQWFTRFRILNWRPEYDMQIVSTLREGATITDDMYLNSFLR